MPDKSRIITGNEGDQKVDEATIARELSKVDKELSKVAAELAKQDPASLINSELLRVHLEVSKAAPR